MAATAAVSVDVMAEAADRVKELGLQREFETMLEHVKQTVDGLQSVEVNLFVDRDEPGDAQVVIQACKVGPGTVEDPTWDKWVDWFVSAFPPQVCRWFIFHVSYRSGHGRQSVS